MNCQNPGPQPTPTQSPTESVRLYGQQRLLRLMGSNWRMPQKSRIYAYKLSEKLPKVIKFENGLFLFFGNERLKRIVSGVTLWERHVQIQANIASIGLELANVIQMRLICIVTAKKVVINAKIQPIQINSSQRFLTNICIKRFYYFVIISVFVYEEYIKHVI